MGPFMARTRFSFTDWATRLGRMLDCVARNGPVNYYVIREALKRKGYGGGTMQRDLQLLTNLGFFESKTSSTKKKNRKSDYDLTLDGIVLFLSIASLIGSFRSKNYIQRLLQKYPNLLPRISSIYEDCERLRIDDLAEMLMLEIASQLYDKATISSLNNINPLDMKREFAAHLVQRPYTSNSFEHLFFMLMAPPSLYLRTERVRLERALQSPSGTALRKQVIAELELAREHHSAMLQVIDEQVKYLNLEP